MFNCFSSVWFFEILWTVAHQAALSMGLSRQEYWNGLSCHPPGDLPDPRIKPASPAAKFFIAEPLGKLSPANICSLMSFGNQHSTSVKWYLGIVLMCISLMLLYVNVLDCVTVFFLVLFSRLTLFLTFFF